MGDTCSDIGFFAAGRPPVADILHLAEAVATRLGEDPLRAQRWAAVWTIHQAARRGGPIRTSWRPSSADKTPSGYCSR